MFELIIKQLNYDNKKTIRSIFFNGEPWFLSNDICELLQINQVPKALTTLDKDEIKTAIGADQFGNQIKAKVVNECGLYHLIFQSKSENAKKIKKWFTSEVLPQIRQTGGYTLNRSSQLTFVQRFWDNFDRVDPGYFSVIGELLWYIYAKVEKLGHVIPTVGTNNKEIWPDISVGRLFSKWLVQHYPNFKDEYKRYSHIIRGRVNPNARQYPNSFLPFFREFLDKEWLPNHAVKYFADRDPQVLAYLSHLIQ